MNPIKSIIDGLFQSRPPQDDEYINEADGLIYCSKCHTPRQCRIQYGETFVTPKSMCRCQREEYEKEQADFQKRQHLMRIQRLKAGGLQDRYLHDYTFANDKGYNPAEFNIANIGHDTATIGVLLIPASAREKDRPAGEEVYTEILECDRVGKLVCSCDSTITSNPWFTHECPPLLD